MQMERERRNSVVANGNQNHYYDYDYDGDYSSSSSASSICRKLDYDELLDRGLRNRDKPPIKSSKSVAVATAASSLSPSSSPPPLSGGAGGVGFIEHPVSKLDTLAGVAIKYGVEVADIKRMNGLVTDLQMFALKSLQIPLPGRHPPSPCLSISSDNPGHNCCDQTPSHHMHSDPLDSFQSLRLKSTPPKVSLAMSSLRDYYGLKQTDEKTISGGFEMAVYRKGAAHYLEDGPFLKPSPASNRPLSHHRKSRSLANGLVDENGDLVDKMLSTEGKEVDSDKWNEKLVRRRQKSEADFTACTSETLLEDNSGGSGFSVITGRGLALRNKTASQTALVADAEAGGLNPIPVGLGDSLMADGLSLVRKSSSTSSLQEQDSNISSVWPTSKWSLKQDLQALSTAAIARPIFDVLPKPISGRKNKAALD